MTLSERPWPIVAALMLVGAALLHTASAQASAEVDRARLALEEGHLDEALEMLNEAARGDELNRADLGELLLLRASIEMGLQDTAAADLDLERLARLGINGPLPPFVGPSLRQRFESLRGRVEPLAPRLNASRTSGGIEISFDNDEGRADMVRGYRIWTRVAGSSWQVEEGRRLRLLVPMGGRVDYYGHVIGLGGAILAALGSRDAPRSFSSSVEEHTPDAVASGGSDTTWIWVVTGVAVVAAGVGVGLYFALDDPAPADTQFGPPLIAW